MAQKIKIDKQDPDKVSSLNLAFIGDSVYEVIVRNKILYEHNGNLDEVNKRAKTFSMAVTQNKMMHAIKDMLNDDEMRIFKRGRNAKSLSAPKSCTISEYRQATGFEALIGYLFLKDDYERIMELVDAGMEAIK